jgi:aminoglycoside phosphotransferase (APT) family kinase protein
MGREYRLIHALQDTPVPVPKSIGLCQDDDVNGAPFYVMEFVEGSIVRDAETAEKIFTREQRQHAGESIVDTLAAIHAVNLKDVGLDDLARHEGYIERQLKRWHSQFQASAAENKREVPVIDEMHDFLASRIPDQGPAAIVHGDYRLDNCMLGFDNHIAAVLDWEICTLGDPMADLGLLAVYWTDPGDSMVALATSPTAADGFLRRDEVMERYAARSGRDMSCLGFYIAFGYWKLACILEGVYARYVGGNMGTDATGFEMFGQQVVALAEHAREALEASF